MAWLLRWLSSAAIALALAGCLAGPQPEPPTGGGRDAAIVDGASRADSGPAPGRDSGAAADAGAAIDASVDAGILDGAIMDGDVMDGDVMDGDVVDGDVPDGDVLDGDVSDGDVADGAHHDT